MRMIKTWVAGAALGLLGGAVALAGPAAANHEPPILTVGDVAECGEVTVGADLPAEPHGGYEHAALVVQTSEGDHTVAELGETITVGPFDTDEVAVRYRVWGGGERDYDSPAVTDLDALVDYLDAEDAHTPTDADAPGIGWHEQLVQGCPKAEDEGEEKLECVSVNDADAETLQMLRHIGPDRATQIIDLRPFSSVEELDQVDGLAAGGERLAELVEGGGEWLPLCDLAGGDGNGDGDGDGSGQGGSLPETGLGALPLLLIVGGAAVAIGGTAVWIGRRRVSLR